MIMENKDMSIRIVAIQGGKCGYIATDPDFMDDNKEIYFACSTLEEMHDYLCRLFTFDEEGD